MPENHAENDYLATLPTMPSCQPLRHLLRLELESALVVIDSDVRIVGDRDTGFVLSAEFTPARIDVRPSAVLSYAGRDIDMNALLAAAQATGERVFRMDDYLSLPPASPEGGDL